MARRGACREKGFTLVELLIVIIIIGILAAIAVPRFANSTLEARESTLASNLGTLREAVDRYYHEHGGRFPGAVDHTDGIGVPADDGARTAAFAAQLTAYSDRNGKTSATFDRAAYPFGPYLRMGIPVNPLPDADAPGVQAGIAWVVGGTDPLTADGAASEAGWKFNAETGRLIANSDDLSSDGIRAYDAW